MQSKKEIYYKHFKDKILPIIIPLDKIRKNTLRKTYTISAVFFVIGIFFSGMFIFNLFHNKFNPIIFPTLLFLTYFFFIKSIINIIITSREYRRKTEEKIEPLFCEPIANFTNWPKGLDIDAILSSGLFYNFDTAESSTCRFGIYANTNIIISDAQINLPPKGTTKPTLFKGTLIQLELPDKINNHIIIESKTEPKCNKYKSITSGITEFDNLLKMYAKNNNKKILTNDLHDAIKNIITVYNAKSIMISVNYNTVLIAIKYKNSNKYLNINSSLTDIKNYDELIEKFIAIYNIVDCLTDSLKLI